MLSEKYRGMIAVHRRYGTKNKIEGFRYKREDGTLLLSNIKKE